MRTQCQTSSAAVTIPAASLMVSEQASSDRRLEFETLVARELPRFRRMAMRWMRNREDAEDAVQDAVLSAFKHISSFEGRARMSSWVMSIVINSVKMQLRKTKRKALPLHADSLLTVADTLPHPGPNPEQICQSSEIHGILTQSIRQLSLTQRMSLQLFEIGGLSLKEAAQTLGVPLGTVKAQLARGRGRLRKRLWKVLGAAGNRTSRVHSGLMQSLSPSPAARARASSQPRSRWALANADRLQEIKPPMQSLAAVREGICIAAMEFPVESSPVQA